MCKNFSSLLRWSPNPLPLPRPLPRPRPDPRKINLSNATTRQHWRHYSNSQSMGKCTYSRWSASNTLCIRPPHLTLLHHCFPDIFPDQLPWKMQEKNMFELLERRKHHRLVHKKNFTVILYLKWKLLLTSGCSPFSGHACTPGSTGGPLELPSFNLFSSLKIINVLYEFPPGVTRWCIGVSR